MIVDYLHFVGITSFPTKHDAPLIVDTNTVLPGVVASQGFKAITRGRAKIAEFGCRVDHAGDVTLAGTLFFPPGVARPCPAVVRIDPPTGERDERPVEWSVPGSNR